jgi:hypothetical protein
VRSRVKRGGGGSGITSSAARPTTYLTGDRFMPRWRSRVQLGEAAERSKMIVRRDTTWHCQSNFQLLPLRRSHVGIEAENKAAAAGNIHIPKQ